MKKAFYYSKDGCVLSRGSNQNRWLWTRDIEDLMEGNLDFVDSVKPYPSNNYFCSNYHKYFSDIEYPHAFIRFDKKNCGKCPIYEGLGRSCMIHPFFNRIEKRLENKTADSIDKCIGDIMALVLWMEEFEEADATESS